MYLYYKYIGFNVNKFLVRNISELKKLKRQKD
jgi:hypothetical protein